MQDLKDPRIKRLIYRSKYTGTKELDTLLGRFVERRLAGLTDKQVAQLERLVENSNPDLYMWISGRTAPPADWDNEVLRMLQDFNAAP